MNQFNKIFDEAVAEMSAHNMSVPVNNVQFQIPDGTNILRAAMEYFISKQGKQLVWLPEYDEVGKWLENNEGRGLLLYGNCGQGKTILCRYAIPAILLKYKRLVCKCYDMEQANKEPDKVLSSHILSLDDVGVEAESIKFGARRMVLAEALDASEKYGKLLMLTSNLDRTGLIEKYGDRVMDRIISTLKKVPFNGQSLRK